MKMTMNQAVRFSTLLTELLAAGFAPVQGITIEPDGDNIEEMDSVVIAFYCKASMPSYRIDIYGNDERVN